MTLANLRKIGEALNIITTEILLNPYWKYCGLLSEKEVIEFLEARENCSLQLLKKVAYYVLTYAENTALAVFYFNDFDRNYFEWIKPVLEKLRELFKEVQNTNDSKVAFRKVMDMIWECLNYGIDPL